MKWPSLDAVCLRPRPRPLMRTLLFRRNGQESSGFAQRGHATI
jgi:hypothetical protein